jgi:zinc transporter 1/2/3
MLASNIRIIIYVAYTVELGTITSVGVAAGILVTEYVQDPTAGQLLAMAILQAIAAGTLLFVNFLEALDRARTKETRSRTRQIFCHFYRFYSSLCNGSFR